MSGKRVQAVQKKGLPPLGTAGGVQKKKKRLKKDTIVKYKSAQPCFKEKLQTLKPIGVSDREDTTKLNRGRER